MVSTASMLLTLLERAPLAIVTLDCEGRVVHWNAAATQMFGWSADEVVGTVYPLVPPELSADFWARFERVMAGSEVLDGLELPRRRKDGTPIKIRVWTALLDGADRRPEGVLVIAADQTERDRAAARATLRRSEERLRLAIEAAGLGTWEWDSQTGRVTGSPRLYALLGLSPEPAERDPSELIGMMDAADRGRVRASIRRALQGQADELDVELRVVLADETARWLDARGRVFRDDGGRPRRMTGIVLDVTDRKNAERQRDVLAQVEKLRALGQLASGIAHDLNQSLALIAGFAELAQQAAAQQPLTAAPLHEALTAISTAAHSGAETLKRLLTFARGHALQPREPLSLGSLVQEVARLTAPRWRDAARAEGRPITLRVETAGDTTIVGSSAELREALTNLILNAVDALPDGGEIRMSVSRVGREVVVEIVDTGVGMPPEIQARAFEPFFTTKGAQGTGLGLPQVYGIVEQHRGMISVESSPGRGTRFRLAFPSSSAELQPVGPAAPEVTAAQPDAGVRLRILVVDDEPKLAKMAAMLLARDGHSAHTATSAEAALDILTSQKFDLVISDVTMGAGLNGWELADQIQLRWPGTRIVLATGWGAVIDQETAQARGIERVLAKPYRASDLLRAAGLGQPRTLVEPRAHR